MTNPRNPIAAALGLALLGLLLSAPVQAEPSSVPTDKYIAGQGAQFESFAGSQENLSSLAHGLRTGTRVTLVEQTSTGPKVTTFTPATKPMGYGNITRSMDLANRQLASVGITDPTAAQIKAAMNGGTVTTANGDVRLDGVLNLRSQGMGWGKIAHTIGVHPSGHASAKAPSPTPVPTPHTAVTTAAGPKSTDASVRGHGSSRSGIVTAAGGPPSSAGAHGRGHATGHGSVSSGHGIQTAAGGHGGGGGNGHAYGRAGK